MSLKNKIQQSAKNIFNDLVSVRRHLHQNPELSFQEFHTAEYLASFLEKENIPFKKGIAKTGIVALIKGTKPSSPFSSGEGAGGEAKVVALRADMDALPILETNKIEYKSKNDGVMHACGHDVHMTSLLGAAKILNQLKNEFEGTVKLIFQPSEEKSPGGASVMIKEGVLENPKVQSIIGQHVYPQLEAGKVGMRAGNYMASADEIYITVKGKGGHASAPHLLVDPIVIASHIIIALQEVVSRNADPFTPSVLSFGKIIGNGANNVIPDEVKIDGTFRTYDEKWRIRALELVKKKTIEIAKSMSGEAEVFLPAGYPFLKNDEQLTQRAFSYAQQYLGNENVVELPMRMSSEDFSFYTHHVPGCFYRLGTGNASKGITSNIHTSTFNIDESALEIGAGLMAWMAVNELSA